MEKLRRFGAWVAPSLFLAFTAFWLLAVLTVLARALTSRSLPDWLSFLSPYVPAKLPTIGFGETGDFLTGWLQPLVLTWFVLTVFLQMRELRLQRQEFEKLKEEYRGNKIATQEQATHLERANTLNNRILVRSLIQDSKQLVEKNASYTLSALDGLSNGGGFSPDEHKLGEELDPCKRWLRYAREFRDFGHSSQLTLEVIWADPSSPRGEHHCARDLIERMANQYMDLKQEASRARLDGYYDAICFDTVEGEVTRVCWELCSMRDQAKQEI